MNIALDGTTTKGRVNLLTPTNRKRCIPRSGYSSSKKLRAAFKSPVRQNINTTKPEDVASLKEEVAELEAREGKVAEEIQQLIDEGYREDELETHISKLHDYNEIKDVGQIILGRLAILLRVTTKDIYTMFELNLDD
ncbi:hypothetical protein LSAT2_019491 [Lamellibrachia satsuma]|nr:hypothetical protein LSAT2_019491 [Lamellibrachia satsuma]